MSLSPRRLSLRTLLVLVALLPALGMATLASVTAVDRWSTREAARELADHTEELDDLVEARAAVADEQNYSVSASLATAFGLDLDDFEALSGLDLTEALAEARASVDDLTLPSAASALEDARAELKALRIRLDAGRADFDDVAAGFAPITALFDDRVADEFDQIEDTAAGTRLPGGLDARIDALDASLHAFAQIGPLATYGTQVLLGSELIPELLTTQSVVGMVEANSQFDAAVEAAMARPDLPAADAWQEFLADPGAQRTEDSYDLSVEMGLGIASPESLDPQALSTAFADGGTWSDLVNQSLQTASADVRQEATDHARAETASMVWRLAGTALVAAIALFVAVRIARSASRPIERIAAAATLVREGELDIGHVEPGGPREVASTAEAFNDMATTLAEVERRTIALAEEPDDPSLATPLPGRVGQALQGALDRLRVSIRLAEFRRAELERVATHDGLTGLLNRTAALDAIDRLLAQARRDLTSTFGLFMDLDGLKQLNDTHGHDVGDDAIRLAADALRSETRDADVVARLGGDEFLVAGRAVDGPDDVEAMAERIVAAVSNSAVRVVGGEIPLRCSIGIAMTSPGTDTDSVDALVRQADVAVYRAKRAGGDRVAWDRPVPESDCS